MYNPDTEVFFPLRVVPQLRGLRGEAWNQLVDQIQSGEASLTQKGAFVLMMVRIGGCVNCNSNSFRAMRGCSQCAKLTVKRYRGQDSELVEQFQQVQKEVEAHLKKQVG